MVKFTRKARGHFLMLMQITMHLITCISGQNIAEGTYTYTGFDGQKYKVPIERIYHLSQLHKGDHIAIERYGLYWHHAIVEDVQTENDTISVIEYSNSVKGFSQDNSSPPKNPGIARVRRGKYNGSKDVLYLIKHGTYMPADDVVARARSRLGENEYGVFSNNCEHFALWCKTGISSSEQVENIEKMARNTVDETVKNALLDLFAGVATQVASKGGEVVTATIREVTREVVSQTVSKGGKVIKKASGQTVAKQVVSETVSNGGQQILKIGSQTRAKQVVSETVSNGGQQMIKIVTQATAKQVVSQTVSNSGQQILISGTRETTKEVFSHTAKKAGEEIVTKGTRETTREVVTQTPKTTGNSAGESLVRGAAFAVVFETAFAAYDIYCTNEDLKAGKISEKEYNDAVGKRIVGGVGSVVGSTTGAVFGQLLFPVPVVGRSVGSVAGALAGRFLGGALWVVAK